MPRGPGQKRYTCFCKLPSCGKTFKAKREDAKTCSTAHRKAFNRLMGGDDDSRRRAAVTDQPNGQCVYRVLLNGKHIATKPTRWEAEQAIAGWLETFDGEFTVQESRPRVKR